MHILYDLLPSISCTGIIEIDNCFLRPWVSLWASVHRRYFSLIIGHLVTDMRCIYVTKKKSSSSDDLNSNDNPGRVVTQVQLRGENYNGWVRAMETSLCASGTCARHHWANEGRILWIGAVNGDVLDHECHWTNFAFYCLLYREHDGPVEQH